MAPLLSINCATDDSRPAYSELRGLRGRGWRMDAPEAKGENERERGRDQRRDFLAGIIPLTEVPCLVKMAASLVCSSCCSRV